MSCWFNSCVQPSLELSITGLSRSRSPFQHSPKSRYLTKAGLHFALTYQGVDMDFSLNPHGHQFMLWNAKITKYSVKTVTDLWPASGNHVLSLCKSNHAQCKGPSGPLCYRKEKPTYYQHWSEKKMKYSNLIQTKKKKNQRFFSQHFFSPFSQYSFR